MPRMPSFYSSAYVSDMAYVNGVPVKDIKLSETKTNKMTQIFGHINDRPIFIQRKRRGMTKASKKRKLSEKVVPNKKRAKTERKKT